MQGLNYLDLAKNIADSHLSDNGPRLPHSPSASATTRVRTWIGLRLIHTGERIVPHPPELQLKLSTGPPCP
jgi:hypothetical protein